MPYKIQQIMKKINYLFVLSGLKLLDKQPRTTRCKYAFFIFNFIWFNSSCLGSLSWLCMGVLNGKGLAELSFVAPCLTFGVLGSTKAAYYIKYNMQAFKLIDDLIKLDVNRKDTDHIEIVNEIKRAESNFLNNVLNVLNVMYILVIILYDAGPLVGTAVTYFRTGELQLFLPFFDVYPVIDALSLRFWPYAYVHQFWAVCLVLFFVGAVDCFLLTCCTYIRIQFKLVKLDIENIIPAKDKLSDQVRQDTHFQSKLKELVRRHQEIISLSNTLQKIYSKSILINVVTSSIIICLTGFNVTVQKELTLVLPSVAFLVTSLLQVLCLCRFGDLLMSSSEEIGDAVYASKWYLADKEITRKLIFIQARAQIPCKLSASGFMEVNLRAFMKILSTSWSYFALLRTVYDR